MTIHVLVEGPSERAFLETWAPRFLRGVEFRVHPHQGKGDLPAKPEAPPDPLQRGLLHQLPAKLRAFAASFGPDDGVLVLVDADDDDCVALKEAITRVVEQVAPSLSVVVRIAVEETEAFYLGDQRALLAAYPSADLDLARDYAPDSVCGTWELFGRVVQDDGARKVVWARSMGAAMSVRPEQNRSPSFRALCRGLKRLAALRAPERKKRRYYFVSKRRKAQS